MMQQVFQLFRPASAPDTGGPTLAAPSPSRHIGSAPQPLSLPGRLQDRLNQLYVKADILAHCAWDKAKDNQGMGTLEIVIIIAILLALALTFKSQIVKFSTDLFKKVFDKKVIDSISYN